MEPHLNDMIQYGFYALISFVAMRATYQMDSFNRKVETFNDKLEAMVKSVEALNLKIAVVIERSDQHDKILDKHGVRLDRLEEH